MVEKRKKLPEYCGECLKSFSYLDWADPIAALVRHKAEECKKRA